MFAHMEALQHVCTTTCSPTVVYPMQPLAAPHLYIPYNPTKGVHTLLLRFCWPMPAHLQPAPHACTHYCTPSYTSTHLYLIYMSAQPATWSPRAVHPLQPHNRCTYTLLVILCRAIFVNMQLAPHVSAHFCTPSCMYVYTLQRKLERHGVLCVRIYCTYHLDMLRQIIKNV